MSTQDQDLLLGKLAVHFKVLSKEQVSEALGRRRMAGVEQDLGSFLVAEGYLPPATLQKLERARLQYLQKQGKAQPAAAPAAPAPAAEPIPLEAEPLAAAAPPPAEPMSDTLPLDTEAAPPLEPVDDVDPLEIEVASPSSDPLTLTEAIPMPAPAAPAATEAIPMPAPTAPAATEAIPMPAPAASAPVEAIPMSAPVAPAAPGAAPVAPAPVAVGSGEFPMNYTPEISLENLLQQTQQLGASDLHIHSKAPIKLRLHGELQDASPPIDAQRAEELVQSILDDQQRSELEERQQLDFSYSLPGIGRFRANAYRQRRGLDAVFRAIPIEPPTLEQLGLPDSMEQLVSYHQGIVLFTGPAGCGKSSTMAAMVRLLNGRRPDHILTVEDPIEYVHQSDRCLVNQRQVGPHTESFARALRAALREDPDVIVIGELRDLETISLALTAAETGHLVLGTLHTSSAIRTINRLLGVFPPDQQNQIRTMVSESLRAVVSQRLVPKADGSGRVAAIEVLINNKAIGNMIRESKTFQIQSQMQTGGGQGMKLLDNSLADLLKNGLITQEEARKNADDPKRFD